MRHFISVLGFFFVLMATLTETDPTVVEDAVKYIIFLVDANQLFDTALGMYDFSLVIMIAQHAQKVNGLFLFVLVYIGIRLFWILSPWG